MFFHSKLYTLFFILICISYSQMSLAASVASQTVYLSGSATETEDLEKKKGVVQYANSLLVDTYEYDLSFPADRQFAREAWDYSMKDVKGDQSKIGKSHVLVNGFDIYRDLDSSVVCEYERFTTEVFTQKDFYGKHPTDDDVVVDWMSNQSNCQDGIESDEEIYHKRSVSGIKGGNWGHSEAQFISDLVREMDDLLKTKPDSLVKLFTPRRSNKGAKQMIMSGLEFYGTFDMCSRCLQDLSDFRVKQYAKTGIVDAIRVVLEKRDSIESYNPENLFVIIYHAYKPYGSYSVSGQENTAFSYSLPYDNFSGQHADTLKDTVLAQLPRREVVTMSHVIYGHIHYPFDQKPLKYSEITKFTGSYACIEEEID